MRVTYHVTDYKIKMRHVFRLFSFERRRRQQKKQPNDKIINATPTPPKNKCQRRLSTNFQLIKGGNEVCLCIHKLVTFSLSATNLQARIAEGGRLIASLEIFGVNWISFVVQSTGFWWLQSNRALKINLQTVFWNFLSSIKIYFALCLVSKSSKRIWNSAPK